jgi:UDP-glucose 4-epimerase
MVGQRILVTGGAGFLGSHVVPLLLEGGRQVTIVDDFSNGKWAHLEPFRNNADLKIIEGDVTDADAITTAASGCDAMIHLAVLGLRQSIKEPRRVNSVVVDGTMNCLEAARAAEMELFVNCSSSEVYGTAQFVPMDESHPLHPGTPYAAAKVAQDMYVRSYGNTYGLPWATIRPFNMYGPNSHWQGYRGELIPKMIVRAMNGQPLVVFGDGGQTRDFLYVDDAARAIVAILDTPACRETEANACTGVETSIRRIAELICACFDIDPAQGIEHQEGRPGDVLRHLGNPARFGGLTDWTPQVAVAEGIQRTVDWIRSLPYEPEELLSQEVLRSWE